MPGATFPVGLCTLQVIHHVIPQPSTTSWILAFSSWCLSGPCCSPNRVVYGAETEGLMRCLYTSWHCCIPSLRFTAHVHKVVGVPDGADAPGNRLALLGEALAFVACSDHVLRRVFQACGRRWRPPWPTLGRY